MRDKLAALTGKPAEETAEKAEKPAEGNEAEGEGRRVRTTTRAATSRSPLVGRGRMRVR